MSDQQKILGYMLAKQDESLDVKAFAKALGMSNKDFLCGLIHLIGEGELSVSMKRDLMADVLNECGEEKAIAFFNKISFVKAQPFVSGGSGGISATCPPPHLGIGETINFGPGITYKYVEGSFYASGSNGASGKEHRTWTIDAAPNSAQQQG